MTVSQKPEDFIERKDSDEIAGDLDYTRLVEQAEATNNPALAIAARMAKRAREKQLESSGDCAPTEVENCSTRMQTSFTETQNTSAETENLSVMVQDQSDDMWNRSVSPVVDDYQANLADSGPCLGKRHHAESVAVPSAAEPSTVSLMPPVAFPKQVSAYAAQQLSPSYPRRAAWGTSAPLRTWQQEALDKYLASNKRDFLTVATPGAGKTTYALRVAVELLGRGIVQKLTIVCPTEHLKYQWAEAAARVGIHLDPDYSNSQGQAGSHFDGVVVTYAQVGMNPGVHRARTTAFASLVILDEIHHAGDSLTWGEGVREAFTPAVRRLALTGTPFRSDTSAIPFVTYVADAEGIRRSRADYTYGYANALADYVVRPVIFLSYSGSMHWRTSTGDEVAARLGEDLTKDMQRQAWRTALDPKGQWIPAVLAAADQRLSKIRLQIPDAGGLVIASNQNAARAYAKQLREITGRAPILVLSDDAGASDRIDAFAASTDRWMVAVRMVSEGVDVPRLAVGVYATSTATPMFFAQAVGRFVRSRKRGEVASVFIPSVQPLLGLAASLEAERDHALDRPEEQVEGDAEAAELERANVSESASAELLNQYEALGGEAEFDGVLFDGAQFGLTAQAGSIEEEDYLGIPGLLEPDQVASLLHKRQTEQMKHSRASVQAAQVRAENANIPEHKKRANARRELSEMVSAWSRRSGEAHGTIHMQLRQICGGPEVAKATTEQIQARIATLRKWFAKG